MPRNRKRNNNNRQFFVKASHFKLDMKTENMVQALKSLPNFNFKDCNEYYTHAQKTLVTYASDVIQCFLQDDFGENWQNIVQYNYPWTGPQIAVILQRHTLSFNEGKAMKQLKANGIQLSNLVASVNTKSINPIIAITTCRVVYNIFENFPSIPNNAKNDASGLNNQAFITLASRKVDKGRFEIKTYYDECYECIVSKLKELNDFEDKTNYTIHNDTVMTKENANTMKLQMETKSDTWRAVGNNKNNSSAKVNKSEKQKKNQSGKKDSNVQIYNDFSNLNILNSKTYIDDNDKEISAIAENSSAFTLSFKDKKKVYSFKNDQSKIDGNYYVIQKFLASEMSDYDDNKFPFEDHNSNSWRYGENKLHPVQDLTEDDIIRLKKVQMQFLEQQTRLANETRLKNK